MATKTRDFSFELKGISDTGTFDGYGSVFGVKDSYDEIVAPGAFADSLAAHKTAGTMPAMLWQHRSAEPAGVWTSIEEDSIGLKMTGQLALKTQRGAEAYELLKMKAISGLSIGFMTREDAFDRVSGVRTLKKVDLWETSLVTFPANDSARIQGVKNIEGLTTLSEIEDYLREAGGFSRNEAKCLIARIKKSTSADAGEDLARITAALTRNTTILKG
jgi:HK97 family phage prohead protease